MDASYKIQRGIHVHLIQFFMCPEFWVHISSASCRLGAKKGHDPFNWIVTFSMIKLFGRIVPRSSVNLAYALSDK